LCQNTIVGNILLKPPGNANEKAKKYGGAPHGFALGIRQTPPRRIGWVALILTICSAGDSKPIRPFYFFS
jgi:hypothetical protein